jgi:hypothetical protein
VILRSIRQVWPSWCIVYIEAIVVTFVALTATVAAVLWNLFFGALVACPLGATALFIVARLTGRLAWRIGEEQTAGKKKRKRKKKTKPETEAA